jgi:hypothetical protein
MNELVETESQLYGWIVDCLHRSGPFDLYPLLLREAAEQALQMISEGGADEEVLQYLIPEARDGLKLPWGEGGPALWPIIAVGRNMSEVRPYSRAIFRFLTECLVPPATECVEDAARVGFEVAGLHLSGLFVERRGKRRLHLETTARGEVQLGGSVRLSYSADRPFFSKEMIEEAGAARGVDRAVQRGLEELKCPGRKLRAKGRRKSLLDR